MKRTQSISEKILGDSNEIIDESINKLLGYFDSLQFVRDQFQYELEIRNEEFLKKFDQILENSLNSIESLRSDREYVNKRMAKRISKAERQISIQEKELQTLREKNRKLESDHLELRSQHKEIQYSEERLRGEVTILRKREKEMKELSPSSPRHSLRGSLKKTQSRQRMGKRTRKRKSSQPETPEPVSPKEPSSITKEVEVNKGKEKPQKIHMVINDHFLDELLAIQNEYSENLEALNDEEKKMYLNKVKFLVERSQMVNKYERKLAFLKRKRDTASVNLEKSKINKEKNKVKYFNKKLLDIEKQIHSLEQEKSLKHGRNISAFQKLDAAITKTVKVSIQKKHEQMKRNRELKHLLIRENIPRGKVVIIFTDIQGSTKIWQKDSTVMLKALKIHNEIVQKYIKRMNGYEVKTEGDSYMIAFQVVKHALNFCMKVQLALLSADWPKELDSFEDSKRLNAKDGFQLFAGLRCRMGCNYGKPVSIEKSKTTGRFDYFGPMVNRAARIESLAHGGEILISQNLYRQIEMKMSQFFMPVDVTNLGRKKMKGFGKKEYVYRINPSILKERAKYFLTAVKKFSSKRNPNPGSKKGAGNHQQTGDSHLSRFIERTESMTNLDGSGKSSGRRSRPGSGATNKGDGKTRRTSKAEKSSLLHILSDERKAPPDNSKERPRLSTLAIERRKGKQRSRKQSTALEHIRKRRTRTRSTVRGGNSSENSPSNDRKFKRKKGRSRHKRAGSNTPNSGGFKRENTSKSNLGGSDLDLIGLITDLEAN